MVPSSVVATKSRASITAGGKPQNGGGSGPVLQPIRLHDTPAAQVIRHVVPALHLGLFCIRFNVLVDNPVATMWSSLPITTALQLVYALICLPAVGSQAAKIAKKPRPGEKRKPWVVAADGTVKPNKYVAAILSLALTLSITPLLHAIIILFGAPLLTHDLHTLLCATHMALLAIFPVFYARGVESDAWLAVFGVSAPLDETVGALVGSLVGAWLGAVPIPLDWDRAWQKWPVTILCGVYAGYVLGKTVGGTVGFGRKLA